MNEYIFPMNKEAMKKGTKLHKALLEGGPGYDILKEEFNELYPNRESVEKRYRIAYREYGGFPITGKIDFIMDDRVYDLKSTNNPLTEQGCSKLCDNFHYDMQMAVYTLLVNCDEAVLVYYQKEKKKKLIGNIR